ncbi:MAG: alpha/beta hydrolase [Clostridiales Family XIII bacterium]|jgi:acetyl esterase|nr:alpha/beta hydrolase [Clostridiales Family XIII bacterium]
MDKYEPIHKRFPLTAGEAKAAKDSAKTSAGFARLPQPILAFTVGRLLRGMREASLKIALPEVRIRNEIIKEEYTDDAGSGAFSVYFYRRTDLPEGKYPLIYFIHGGGFIGGTYLANEGLMKKLADENDLVCASTEYHVAPEARYPAALRECERGLFRLLKSSETRRFIDAAQIYVSGDSAGGNLAAAMALSLRNLHDLVPAGQILLYPVTDMDSLDKDSYNRKEPEFSVMRKMILLARKMYARDAKDYTDICFSPLLSTATDDPNPPRALLLLAERDGLLCDGLLYGEHLHNFGGEVRTVVYDGAYHAFANGLGDSDAAEDAYAEIVGFVGGRGRSML